ncbi:response regulator [Pelagicoccus sp. SDUM812003]|uniref:response regulator n=1 Tax=Pelagicoccus sp. SDUM812003 TaxID=3041267 RepID=UPI00280FEB26|nr:response regulator [Pelagicoccus sp. SDUM812003]MDQ8202182.1 response regulator [Pelagicoccus sp. SDUM812003]
MIQDQIKILHLEDDHRDADLIEARLETADIDLRIQHVQKRQDYEGALKAGHYDLILADYKLPAYDGISALLHRNENHPEIPFIFVSGTIGEKAAIEGLTQGATDYILKQDMTRLPSAISRAISEAKIERERREAVESLRESETKKTLLNTIASMYLSASEGLITADILNFLVGLFDSESGSCGYFLEDGELVVPDLGKSIWKPLRAESGDTKIAKEHWEKSILHPPISECQTTIFQAPCGLPGDAAECEHMVFAPVVDSGKTIAFLLLGRSRSPYSKEEIALLEEIVRFISPVLNARLERDRYDRLRHQTEMKLISAKEKAEENDRLKTAFLQNISHEIRTPMNAIYGFSTLLEDPTLTLEEQKGFIEIIRSSSTQLLSIVTDILTIASIETHQLDSSFDTVSIKCILAELYTIFQPQATERGIRLVAPQATTDEDINIESDRSKLVQILSNLLSNALKFTHEGSVAFGYSIQKDSEPNYLEFFVRDTGIGIDPDAQEVIFNRFHQAAKSTHEVYGGMGLGLSISKGLVELLGGSIRVQSQPGKGSTFFVTLPIPSKEQADTRSRSEVETKTSTNRIRRKALIVEDDKNSYVYLERVLRDLGYQTVGAKNGSDAVSACRNDNDIELVLMDLKIPILDGYEAAKAIKKIRPSLRIIAQTAYVQDRDKLRDTEAFDDYIAKPMNKEQIEERLKR